VSKEKLKLKKVKGWLLPSTDTSFDEYITENGYQHEQRQEILEYIHEVLGDDLKNCVDVGGHVGFWAKDLMNHFKHVHVFEPIPFVRECFYRNIPRGNWTMYKNGLGNKNTKVQIKYNPLSSGDTFIDERPHIATDLISGTVNNFRKFLVRIIPLDELNLKDVDYIKIDAEGYEAEVIKGASDTITRCKPFVHCEIKDIILAKTDKNRHEIFDIFKSLGYHQVLRASSEYLFSHKSVCDPKPFNRIG
jgi:FkbM family methyltransferase